MTEENAAAETEKTRLLDAIKPHVPFDGWTDVSLRAAAEDLGTSMSEVRAICPRGAVDLALAFHAEGDAAMVARLQGMDMSTLRFRDKVVLAVRTRLEVVEDRELVRRGATLFALPPYAADGARALWRTVDLIWTTLGDTSRDFNWYTKRATLSGVYGSTVLYWLGDDSLDQQRTWNFLDRRIEDVMRFEKLKASVKKMPGLGTLAEGAERVMSRVRAPMEGDRTHLPGRWNTPG
ncbi:MAG: COQ9 family protein [Pseudomonadota bacterium]